MFLNQLSPILARKMSASIKKKGVPGVTVPAMSLSVWSQTGNRTSEVIGMIVFLNSCWFEKFQDAATA